MHIVLVYRYYNDGIAYYNLTFVRKISNDRFGFITTSHFVNFAFPKLAFIKKFRTCNQSQMRNFVYLPGD